MERPEDEVSVTLADSMLKLINDGTIDKVEAARAVSNNQNVYDKIRNVK